MVSPIALLHYLLFMHLGTNTITDYQTPHCNAVKNADRLPRFNRVTHTSPPSAADINNINAYFNGSPYTWFVSDTDAQTLHMLAQQGLHYKASFPAMILDIHTVSPVIHKEYISIKLIDNPADQASWLSLVASTFKMNETELSQALNTLMERAAPDAIKLYVGLYQDTPAATCMLIYHGSIVSMQFISTADEYRNKGLGYAITHHALSDAQAKGCTHAILLSSTMGRPLYERLGFRQYELYHVYGND